MSKFLLRRFSSLLPLCMLTLAYRTEEMPGQFGFQEKTLSLLLMVLWTGLTQDMLLVEASPSEVEQQLERANKFLAAGQFADALSQYHSAIDGDPTNYMSYFKRATVYLAMGKSKSALPDLDKVLELKPDFNVARIQRAGIRLKQGKISEAQTDYNDVLTRDPSNADAKQHLEYMDRLQSSIAEAKQLYERNDCMNVINFLHQPVEICPWAAELREMRADCFVKVGDYHKAITDLRSLTKLINDNTEGYLKLSKMLYENGNSDESLIEIRECLKLDPDHNDCHKHYKKVKKLVQIEQSIESMREKGQWTECIAKVEQFNKIENTLEKYKLRSASHLCACHSKAKNVNEALKYCNEVLEKEPQNAEALCDRADTYLANEDFEKAIDDFRTAEGIEAAEERHKSRAQEGHKRAQKLLKQSQKRDYYKILGVKRTASKAEILKAYRKLAAQWHPDQHQGADKEKAEKLFIDIAAAKEVLTDPEKRAKFDEGEDPLDPEQQAGGGGPHWQQGFNPFGQGGFQFKFHF